MISGFGVEVTAVALKLGGDHDRIGVVQLHGREAPARTSTADGGVRRHNLIELWQINIFPSAI